MISSKKGKRVDSEITRMSCVFDPSDTEELRMPYFIAVGWDKKIHVWADEKEEVVVESNKFAQDPSSGHQDDIMSTVYYPKTQLIYTGGHDGTLIAWNFETGYRKHSLHENDNTEPFCTSENYLKDGKSVDQLLILDNR
jgi:WD40 repeat protein